MTTYQQFALTFLGQSVLILGLATVVAHFCRTPSARVAILRYALVGVVAVTLLRALAPSISNPWITTAKMSDPAVSHSTIQPSMGAQIAPQTSAVSNGASEQPATRPHVAVSSKPVPAPRPVDLSWVLPAAIAIWLFGTLFLLLRMVLGGLWIRKLQDGAQPIAYSRADEVIRKAMGRFNLRT